MKKYAAILLSRQPLRPTGDTAWVQGVTAAVGWLRDRRMGVVSSVGMQTWELITAAASDLDLPMRLILPVASGPDFDSQREGVLREFDLDPSRAEFLSVSDDQTETQSRLMTRRDRAVFETADVLLPVSLSDRGSMTARLQQIDPETIVVDDSFRSPYTKRSESLKVDLDLDRLSDEVSNLNNDYLVHWTRGVSHPWPGERMLDFYRAIVRCDRWPRSGMATLERILDNRMILASDRHQPERATTVSFSALRPGDAMALMRWRARYGEMSFEPYGIGVDQQVAEKHGVLPVVYHAGRGRHQVPANEVWRSQSNGKITDWRQEAEYRHHGHFCLEHIPSESVLLFCRTPAEAERLRGRYPYRVVSFMS